MVIFCLLSEPYSGSQIAQNVAASPTATSAQPEHPTDLFGRSTPRGTVSAFIRAVHRDDFLSAARYMQVTARQRRETKELAHDLRDLMDRYFHEPIASISNVPTGNLDDGLPLDRERIGPLEMPDKVTDIILVRVSGPEGGQIWLISSDTLEKLPALHRAIQEGWLERITPNALQESSLLSLSLAAWTWWVMSWAVPFVLLWFSSYLFTLLIAKIRDSSRRNRVEAWNDRLRMPVITLMTLAASVVLVTYLSSSLNIRIVYARVGLILIALAATWLLRRIAALSFERARIIFKGKGQLGTESLILLGERVFNVVIVITAIFAILTIAGVDTRTALAGVGIGGVAIALGAQKTVENLLGGVFLLADREFAVGDTCCISNRIGTVEDITLRSVRLRTTEQTLLSIPAGFLSQSNIENFASRTKTLVKTKLLLRYPTNTEQIRSVLRGIQHLLVTNSKIEAETAHIRLVEFGPQAIELELFAFVLTSHGADFLAIRETLLLQAAEVIEAYANGFATPTQFIHLPANYEDTPTQQKDIHQRRTEEQPDLKKVVKRAG